VKPRDIRRTKTVTARRDSEIQKTKLEPVSAPDAEKCRAIFVRAFPIPLPVRRAGDFFVGFEKIKLSFEMVYTLVTR
jgi:hypothetical protein